MFKCAVCHGSDAKELLVINLPDRFEKSIGVEVLGYSRKWVECNFCGTASNLLPSLSAKAIAKLRETYYEVDFIGSDIGDKYRRVMTMTPSQSDNAGRVSRIIDFTRLWLGTKIKPRVMDIGAGTGVFLSRLVDQTSQEWDCIGVEPDPVAAKHLRQLNKFHVVEDTFCGQKELIGFNLITINKVLEHIEQPLPFLSSIVRGLSAEDSLLYIEVPDILTVQLKSPYDNILGALHCHLYAPMSLAYLVKKVGLELIQVSRIAEPSGKLTLFAFAAPSSNMKKNYVCNIKVPKG
ncbi:MAG: class I SAM-dependent methyltransferase [Polynucleobacter sp.]|nr:class I SAM-dependent methyltransferase [Polynucleobacter sp.]